MLEASQPTDEGDIQGHTDEARVLYMPQRLEKSGRILGGRDFFHRGRCFAVLSLFCPHLSILLA